MADTGQAKRRAELVDALIRNTRGDVDESTLTRGLYSTDASNYRIVPDVVVAPKDADDVAAVVETAHAFESPITMRGGGTSCAGNAVGPGIVLDTTRYLDHVLELNPDEGYARVQPGIVMDELQKQAKPFGLRFGPDPSTHSRCTIGGMIGNNACGSHAIAYGRTSDNVLGLSVLDGTGRLFRAGDDLSVVPGLDNFVDVNLALLRTEFGRFSRQASGYSLEQLLPEKGHSVARALVGTEGTCGLVVEATVRLVPLAEQPILVVLGYPSLADAADAVPGFVEHHPLAVEGFDARLVEAARAHGSVVPPLPDGGGWMIIEVANRDEAAAVIRDSGTQQTMTVPAGPEAKAIWRMREDGAGLAGHSPQGKPAWPGWEDSAVPPENLGTYLREFDKLMARYGVDAFPYGHFGDGCVHARIDIPLEKDGSVLSAFVHEAAELAVSLGGSLSGEHGDGRARSELLSTMYSPEGMAAMAQFKALFDPHNVLNPGIIVNAATVDADLRRPQAHRIHARGFAFRHDGGDFTAAVHRCTGVSKCRSDLSGSGGFMCPSYQATGEEKDVTRGRARMLQELTNGQLIGGSWNSPELAEALDFCLACKACSTDCPAGVDMAKYKSETLFRRYRGRLRPRSHYALGWLPRWTRLITRFAPVVNATLRSKALAATALKACGLDPRRSLPRFATQSFRHSHGVDQTPAQIEAAGRRYVVVWADSFSDTLAPEVPQAVVDVLTDAGYDVLVAPDSCCGLTWITTGQLDGAKKRLAALMGVLAPFATNGIPIVGVEPSCTAVLREDVLDLLPDDPRATIVAQHTYTLAELLTAPAPIGPGPDWQPPQLSGQKIVAQPHCHHYSVMGWQADRELLRRMGADVTELTGCCGMAGNFGMEQGHYDVSMKVAELHLLPALRENPDAIYLADGFSCRTQAADVAGRGGLHLAQLLAGGPRMSAMAGAEHDGPAVGTGLA